MRRRRFLARASCVHADGVPSCLAVSVVHRPVASVAGPASGSLAPVAGPVSDPLAPVVGPAPDPRAGPDARSDGSSDLDSSRSFDQPSVPYLPAAPLEAHY